MCGFVPAPGFFFTHSIERPIFSLIFFELIGKCYELAEQEDVMFTKMMICTDLTPASFSLIACAIELKEIGTKEVVLAHVVESLAAVSGTLLDAEAESVFRRQKEMLEQQRVKVIGEILHGAPVQALIETAERHDVSGILMGSHSKALITLGTLGSVSDALMARTQRPLLLHRVDLGEGGAMQERDDGNIFSHVLFPTDFSETAERALDYLGKIALEQRGTITLLHVISPDEYPVGTRSEEEAQYLLEAKKRRLERLGATEVNVDLVHGKPDYEVVARGKRGIFSLVVMGCQGKGILKRVFMGSTAEAVARHIEVPLLLIPGEQHME